MKIPCLLAAVAFACFTTVSVTAQEKNSSQLNKLLRAKASPLLRNVLDSPDTYQYQIIYTEINRDKNNKPSFKHHYLNVDPNRYFYPASTTKLPVALLALEKLNELKVANLNKHTPMLTDSVHSKLPHAHTDSTAENGLPSVAHYIKKIFLVSDNDAYNFLYGFVGQQEINEKLWQKGYKNVRITRRFIPMSYEEHRHANPVRFVQGENEVYSQPASVSNVKFDFSKKIPIGKAHVNWDDEMVQEPLDFTTHNYLPLQDLQLMVQSVMFPETVPAQRRFNLTPDDYAFVQEYMSKLPFQSDYPKYDTTEFFDSYTKFFMYKSAKSKIPDHMRIYNKTGWAYGFLTDVSYIVDLKNNVEYMLSATIYVNKNEIMNDGKYETDEIGLPFFKQVGDIIHEHELKRKRKRQPDLSRYSLKN